MSYDELHDEPPSSAYIWRLHTLQGARNAAEAEAMREAESKANSDTHTTTSRS